MVCCCAVGCSNRTEEGFKLHRFSRNQIRRAIWISQVNRKNWTPTDGYGLCEIHFDGNQWEPLLLQNGVKKLKRNAVLSVLNHIKRKPRIINKTPKVRELTSPSVVANIVYDEVIL